MGYAFANDDDKKTTFQPLTSSPLTGTLVLDPTSGVEPATRRLLELLNGVHFWKLTCSCDSQEEELRCIMAVVEACSDTLESIDVYISKYGRYHLFGFPYRAVTRLHLHQIHGGCRRV